MKSIFKYIGLFLFVSLAVVGCRQDIETFTPFGNSPNLGRVVSIDVGGVVLDEQGEPLRNVEVILGNKTTITDDNGVFLLRNATTNERRAYITANKSGYFQGSRTMIVQGEKLHYATIRLLEEKVVRVFNSSDAAQIEFDNVKLTFPANGIMLEGGGDYVGEVRVAAKYLDPTDANLFEIMPGDLRGINKEEEEVVLATFGMMAVELIGENGEELQVAENAEVEVETRLPADFVGNAPATIPLWYFDEDEGIWKEEGEAVLDGNVYRGVVTHFSFWNHDFPYPLINVKGQIVDEKGEPLANIPIRIQIVGEKYFGQGRTNEDGFFCGLIPKDFELEISVTGNGPCRTDILYMENIGTHSSDLTLPPIVIVPSQGTAINASFSGRLLDCAGDPVSNGYVRGRFNNYWFNLFVDETDGTFNQSYIFCDLNEDLEIQGYDLDNFLQTDELTFTIDETIPVGDIKACDQIDNIIEYELDGNKFSIPNPSGGPEGDNTLVEAYLDSFILISFVVEPILMTGNFPVLIFNQGTPDERISLSVNEHFRPLNTDVTISITRYDSDPGGLLIGSFEGTFEDMNGIEHTLSNGYFRIERW